MILIAKKIFINQLKGKALEPVTKNPLDRVAALILRFALFLSPTKVPEWWLNMLEETWFIPKPLERLNWALGVLKEAVGLHSKVLMQR